MIIQLNVNEDENIKPYYKCDLNIFIDVTQCGDCKRTASYSDQSPVHCCPNCGGQIKTIGGGKFDTDKKKWLIRER